MGLRIKTAAALGVIIVLASAGGYYLGLHQGAQGPASAPGTGPQQAAATTPGLPPAGGLTQADREDDLPPRAGRAHGSAPRDPAARFTHFRVGQRNVKAILADGPIVWVGTSAGVVRYDLASDAYRLFDVRSGLLANGVFHVGRLDGRVVVGTYGGGMALYDEPRDRWTVYNIPQGLADAFVYDVLESDAGDIWIATWSGVNRVRDGALDDPSQWQTYTVDNTAGGLPNDWVYALAQGREGAIWLATEGGLARYQDGVWQHWRHEDGLGAAFEQVKDQIPFTHDPARFSRHHARQKAEMGLEGVDVAYNPNYIVALLVDHQGVVWCGTWGGGLARFDGSHWRNVTVADGLPANHVFMLHEDPQGRLWVGTSNGLARRTPQGFRVYTTADGLYSNTVFAMASAPDGSVWVGSYGGVARIAGLPP